MKIFFSEEQIINALKLYGAEVKVSEVGGVCGTVSILADKGRWYIVCDNGTEFTSKTMFYWSRAQQIKLDFIQPGKATQNASVESFNGKFRG